MEECCPHARNNMGHLVRVPCRTALRRVKGARAQNRLDATHTNALVSQPETGKISCVRLPCCGRLPPGACAVQRRAAGSGSRQPITAPLTRVLPKGTRWAAVRCWCSREAALPYKNDTGASAMDWNRVEGNWKQFKGQIKEKWGNLTDDDLDKIEGHREQLEGIIQERYGIAKDQVRKDVDRWLESV